MKFEGVDIIDAFGTPVIFLLVENSLTIVRPPNQCIPIIEEILDHCEIEIGNIVYFLENTNESIKLSLGQVLSLQSLLDNHDTYENIALLVEL